MDDMIMEQGRWKKIYKIEQDREDISLIKYERTSWGEKKIEQRKQGSRRSIK